MTWGQTLALKLRNIIEYAFVYVQWGSKSLYVYALLKQKYHFITYEMDKIGLVKLSQSIKS